jgi:molecular chaperone DnaK
VKDLEDAMQGDDQARIEAKTTALEQAAQSLAAAGAAGQGPGPGPEAAPQGKAEDVVDAEFTEVKDQDK